ncbi:MAG: hypothetical protein IPQ13_13895 [Holophagaceae bacterium]|nr:hypothetical protein [Holophagaceae bacterium]
MEIAIQVNSHFRLAWRVFKSHWVVFVCSQLVLFASWVALEVTVVALHGLGVAVNVALHLAFVVCFSGLAVGFHRMALHAVQGGTPVIKDLFGLIRRGPTALVAFIAFILAVAAGLVLLVIPGLYVAVRLSLLGYVLAARPVSSLEAFRIAASLSRERSAAVWSISIKAFGLSVCGAACLGVGLLVAFPVSILAMAGLYQACSGEADPTAA